MKMIDVTELWPPGPAKFFHKLHVATHKKVGMVCDRCGSADIMLDAWAMWDTGIQDWVLSDAMDTVYCGNCDGETGIDGREIKREDK